MQIIFATVAFGIGLDIKDIRQVIHIGLPYSMEEYFQEAGRAGRDGLSAKAHVYYNSYDVSMGKKQLTQVMRDYVTKSKCKREMILNYFGFQCPQQVKLCISVVIINRRFVIVTTVLFPMFLTCLRKTCRMKSIYQLTFRKQNRVSWNLMLKKSYERNLICSDCPFLAVEDLPLEVLG